MELLAEHAELTIYPSFYLSAALAIFWVGSIDTISGR